MVNDSVFGNDSAEAFESVERLKENGVRLVDEYKQEAQRNNLTKIQTEVQIGDPAQAIVEAADAHNSDMIILGSRGLGTFKQVLLGSVSHKVLAHAKCQVMITK